MLQPNALPIFVFALVSIGLSITAAAELSNGSPSGTSPGTKPVWLTNLRERDVKVGWGSLGKWGSTDEPALDRSETGEVIRHRRTVGVIIEGA
jgi:hypothetical protein